MCDTSRAIRWSSPPAGLTSGIDLALHVVELYFGREVAARTAAYMEYEGKGWMRSDG